MPLRIGYASRKARLVRPIASIRDALQPRHHSPPLPETREFWFRNGRGACVSSAKTDLSGLSPLRHHIALKINTPGSRFLRASDLFLLKIACLALLPSTIAHGVWTHSADFTVA